MAEAKKGAAALYGKPPRIENDTRDGDTPKGGGAPDKAHAKAAETADSPQRGARAEADMKSGTNAKGDVMAGTDGITTHHMQHSERDAMHAKHQMEMANLHHRHQHEHLLRATGHHAEPMLKMHERHHSERRTTHTAHEKEMRDMHARHESAPFSADAPAPVGAEAAPAAAA